MNYDEIISKVAANLNIPESRVDKIYKSFWQYIRNSIQELPLKEDLSEVEFLALKPNFNIPSLGKLSVTYDRYNRVKQNFEYIKKLRKR